MLTIAGNARIFISNTPTCMRQSFEGLSLLVEQLFPGELLSGALFVFLNRSCNRMKIMLWDSDGFIIFYKRLEKGSFSHHWGQKSSIDRREFLMLFEGIEPKKIKSRFAIQKKLIS